jgi:hypothetical protein
MQYEWIQLQNNQNNEQNHKMWGGGGGWDLNAHDQNALQSESLTEHPKIFWAWYYRAKQMYA